MKGLREFLGLGDTAAERLTPQVQMGIALMATKRDGETYADTVPYHVRQARRAKNRRAAASRLINRRSAR